jgi:hypothetical protein
VRKVDVQLSGAAYAPAGARGPVRPMSSPAALAAGARSTSAPVLHRPRVRRTADRARPGSVPIADSTGDDWVSPE